MQETPRREDVSTCGQPDVPRNNIAKQLDFFIDEASLPVTYVAPRTLKEAQPNPFPHKQREPGVRESNIVFIVMLLAWVILTETRTGGPSPYAPSPTDILASFTRLIYPSLIDPTSDALFARHPLWLHIWHSVLSLYTAFGVGWILGIVVGTLAGTSPMWGVTFRRIVVAIAALPTMYKIFALAGGTFGLGRLLGAPGVIAAAAIAVFIVVGNVAFAVARDPGHKKYAEAARGLSLRKWRTAFLVILPIGSTVLMAATRNALWVAYGTTAFAEPFMTRTGVGLIIYVMFSDFRYHDMYAIMGVGLLLVVPGMYLVARLEQALLLPGKIGAHLSNLRRSSRIKRTPPQ